MPPRAPHTAYLVDASPYIFRAFFSLPSSLVSPRDEPINAVYGFASFLIKLIGDERPSHLAVCFDGSLTTSFRNELYADYKATRELPPPELEAQQGWSREVAWALGAETFVDDRYEADDLIATLAAGLPGEGHRVVVSSDKDLAQLVDEHTVLFDFARDDRYGAAEVVAKFGVRPEQIVDFLALAGDSVDNIPGVPKVGKKTAVALLEAFADLDEIYGRLDDVAELSIRGARSLAERLEEHREIAFLSRELATVSTEAPVQASLDDLEWSGPREQPLLELAERLGFGALVERAMALG